MRPRLRSPGLRRRPVVALTALAASLLGVIVTTPASAGIPVIDGGNLVQNVMTAIESVAQTLKQIEQYQTQLQQYENMLQNTMAPAAYIWDQALTLPSRVGVLSPVVMRPFFAGPHASFARTASG